MEVVLHLDGSGKTPQEAVGDLKHRISELGMENWSADSTIRVKSMWNYAAGDVIVSGWHAETDISIASDEYLMTPVG